MGKVKSENGHFQFSPKSSFPSDATADHYFFNIFCLIYKLKWLNLLKKMNWINPSRDPRLWNLTCQVVFHELWMNFLSSPAALDLILTSKSSRSLHDV